MKLLHKIIKTLSFACLVSIAQVGFVGAMDQSPFHKVKEKLGEIKIKIQIKKALFEGLTSEAVLAASLVSNLFKLSIAGLTLACKLEELDLARGDVYREEGPEEQRLIMHATAIGWGESCRSFAHLMTKDQVEQTLRLLGRLADETYKDFSQVEFREVLAGVAADEF